MKCEMCGTTEESEFKKSKKLCHKCYRERINANYRNNVNGIKDKRRVYVAKNKSKMRDNRLKKYRDEEKIKQEDKEQEKELKRIKREEKLRKLKI